MRAFMDRDFLLSNETARRLFHQYAENQPIIDYHCHLSPAQIAEDRRYSNITELWLYGDCYKWRAMRSCGVAEKYITGDASDYEKFRAYCACMPKLIGNPLYHWSHLELRHYFDCDLIINEQSCDEIWRVTAEKLADPCMSARNLILRSGAEVICTTDDPADPLTDHARLREEGFPVKVLPSFTPDKGLALRKKGIRDYLRALGEANGVEITDLRSLYKAYQNALDRFCVLGCRVADHGLDIYHFVMPNEYHANEILVRALKSDGKDVSEDEADLFVSQMLRFFGREYVKRGMVMQLRFGALHSSNDKTLRAFCPNADYGILHGTPMTAELAKLLCYLDHFDGLPRTVLYPLNGVENSAVASLCGAFVGSDDGVPRVVQGSAWWLWDGADGLRTQLRSIASLASLGQLLGMSTDSYCLLSYSRHEYFRRVFCDLLGAWVENGEYPEDEQALSDLVESVCYKNAKRYFDF